MSKLKNLWAWIVSTVGGVIGILVYFITLKNKEINKLKAKTELVNTEKEADLLETEIKEARVEKQRLSKEDVEIDKVLDALDERRKQISADVKVMTDEEIEKYWNE